MRNTLGHGTIFDITVFFTSTEAMDLASAATSVPLNAHQSKLWSVKGTFAAPAQVLCVLPGVATQEDFVGRTPGYCPAVTPI